MSPELLSKTLADHEIRLIALERARGAASASGGLLSDPRSGEQPDPLYSSSEAPLPDQAEALLREWEDAAANNRKVAEEEGDDGTRNEIRASAEAYAAAFATCASELRELFKTLGAGAQSAAREAQGCEKCGSKKLIRDTVTRDLYCWDCGHTTHPEAEQASGSGNAYSPDPGPDNSHP